MCLMAFLLQNVSRVKPKLKINKKLYIDSPSLKKSHFCHPLPTSCQKGGGDGERVIKQVWINVLTASVERQVQYGNRWRCWVQLTPGISWCHTQHYTPLQPQQTFQHFVNMLVTPGDYLVFLVFSLHRYIVHYLVFSVVQGYSVDLKCTHICICYFK